MVRAPPPSVIVVLRDRASVLSPCFSVSRPWDLFWFACLLRLSVLSCLLSGLVVSRGAFFVPAVRLLSLRAAGDGVAAATPLPAWFTACPCLAFYRALTGEVLCVAH